MLSRSMIERRVEDFFTSTLASAPSDSLLIVAASGGVDSMVLLSLMLSLRERFGFKVGAAHVDHGLRETSAHDADFVSEFCRSRGLPFFLKRLSPVPNGENVESWCRRERYGFFSVVVRTQKAFAVCTAHHADDVLETFLMRLLANKEPRGILGVDERRTLLRPLLQVRRSEIEAYALENHIKNVEDETNLQTTFVRNRIRNLLLPFISEHFGGSSVDALASRGEYSAGDDELLSTLAEERLAGLPGSSDSSAFGSKGWVSAVRDALERAPHDLVWRIVERAFKGVLPFRLGRVKALELAEVLCGRRVAAQLPGGIKVRRSEGAITVSGV